MAERYYAPGLVESLGDWVLEEEEAHHLLRVRRGKPGDAVQLFDGAGLRAEAVVAAVSKRSAQLRLLSFQRSKNDQGLILGSAPPKGERLLWLIEQCTQLGVKSWTPVVSERTVVHPGDAKIDKLRRKVIEACKQCGRDHLMEIREAATLRDFLVAKPPATTGWFLDPSGEPLAKPEAPSWACVGPEGGWTPAEIVLAKENGWTIRSLPGHVLRIETACAAAASLALNIDGSGTLPPAHGGGRRGAAGAGPA
jgi:16S rRNA (uracil1498-N3)-methyltransferase